MWRGSAMHVIITKIPIRITSTAKMQCPFYADVYLRSEREE